MGAGAFGSNATTSYNTAVGFQALYNNVENNNTGIGYQAGKAITSGYNNTMIGNIAGSSTTTGVNNTCLGYNAQAPAASTYNSFTLGDGNVNDLRCNDTSISSLSDVRDKTNIVDIPFGLNYILAMRPVKFDWDRRDGTSVGKKDFGFIAQELDEVETQFGLAEYTRLVHKDNPDRWEADPMKTYPILIKAIQELKAEFDAYKLTHP